MPKKTTSTSQAPRGSAQLIATLRASMGSTCRFEDRYWDQQLEGMLDKYLAAGNDTLIEAVIERLARDDSDCMQALLEHLQTVSQGYLASVDGQSWQVLLMTAPLAVWTRYQLPQAELSTKQIADLAQALGQTVLNPNARLQLMPQLLGLDEMPRSFSQTRQWLHLLGDCALGAGKQMPKPLKVEPNPALLVDTRHLVLVAAVPVGEPMFQWQMDLQTSPETYLKAWIAQSRALFTQLLPGCQFDTLIPQAYHTSIELSETHVRSVAIVSACQWLQETLNLKPGELRATIAAVGERDAQEYRVGYHRGRQQDVIYGTIWPIFDQPEHGDASQSESVIDAVDEIAAILKQSGVNHIKRIPGVLIPETCDDCGAPYFPNPSGELVHAELPEEAFDAPMHFH